MDVIINQDIESLPPNATVLAENQGFYPNVLHCLYQKEDYCPLGALLAAYHALEGSWVVLSPVHWTAGHNDALITASGSALMLNEKESLCWFESLKAYLSADGYRLFYHDAHHWLISKNHLPEIHSQPLPQAMHCSMMSMIRTLDKSNHWQGFLTETQMFLSSNQLNQQRINEDLPPINGLWVWGQGQMKQSKAAIVVSPSLYPLIKACSENVVIYKDHLRLKDYELLILSNFNQIHPTHQNALLAFRGVKWFWNNANYKFQNTSFFRALPCYFKKLLKGGL